MSRLELDFAIELELGFTDELLSIDELESELSTGAVAESLQPTQKKEAAAKHILAMFFLMFIFSS